MLKDENNYYDIIDNDKQLDHETFAAFKNYCNKLFKVNLSQKTTDKKNEIKIQGFNYLEAKIWLN